MVTRLITERHQLAPGVRVDRAAGVLRRASICGLTSANHRDYLPTAFREAKRLYGMKPIYADHSEGRGGRALADKLGWFDNVTTCARGLPFGDAHLLKSHPLYEMVMEAAERNPRLLGFSHVAECRTSRGANGREVVEAIERVESVDLVSDPATVAGIWESIQRRRPSMNSVKRYLEQVCRKTGRPALRRLIEDADLASDLDDAEMGDDTPNPAALDTTSGSAADEAIAAGIASAGNAVWAAVVGGEIEVNAGLQKLRRLMSALKDAAPSAVGAMSEGRISWSDLIGGSLKESRVTWNDAQPLAERRHRGGAAKRITWSD